MKKIFLLYILLLSIFAMTGCGNNKLEIFKYQLSDNGKEYIAVIDDSFKNMNTPDVTEIVVPDYVGNNPVTDFSGSFNGWFYLKKIQLPSGMKRIRREFFSGCKNLEEVILPSELTEINERAFYECEKLEHITFPNKLEVIGEEAFLYCGLKELTFPESLKRIEEGAFQCNSYIELDVPGTVEYIGKSAFDFDKLTKFSIHEGTDMDYQIFNRKDIYGVFYKDCYYVGNEENPYLWLVGYDGSSGATTLYIHKDCKYTCVTDSYIDMSRTAHTMFKTRSGYPQKITEIIFEEGSQIERINHATFAAMIYLEKVTFPNTLKYLGTRAFDGCLKLSEIHYEGTVEEWNQITKEVNTYNSWYGNPHQINLIQPSIIPASYAICEDGNARFR